MISFQSLTRTLKGDAFVMVLSSENIDAMSEQSFAACLIHFRLSELLMKKGRHMILSKNKELYSLRDSGYVFSLFRCSVNSIPRACDIVVIKKFTKTILATSFAVEKKDFLIQACDFDERFFSYINLLYENYKNETAS